MSNDSNFEKTMDAAEFFYEDSMHNFAAKTLENDGFTARLDFEDKQYWTVLRIDEDAEIVIMEISPSIICLPEARSQLSEYTQMINSKYKTGNIRISTNNSVYIHAEQHFDDGPITSSMFRIMEGACIKILDTFYTPLNKLANCKLITAEEADVDTVISKHDKKIKSKLRELKSGADSFFSRLERRRKIADNTDDDDDDDDDDFVLPEPPGFSAWLKKELKDNSGSVDDSTENDESESTGSSESKGLLDVLLGLPDDATLEEIETSLDVPDIDDSDKSSDD